MVYVSLGTLFNNGCCLLSELLQGIRRRGLPGILSAPASLEPAPANFIVHANVSQIEVLQRATAFVSHGGMNSVNESLSYGVPMVVIPQMGEQMIIGRRVEELGAGHLHREGGGYRR